MRTLKTLRKARLTFTFLVFSSVLSVAISGCTSTTYETDRRATAAAPWKVGEVIATTADASSKGGEMVGKHVCLANGDLVPCDYERAFLGVNKEGHYWVQDFYTPQTVQAYLKEAVDKKAKRTDPYLLNDKLVAQQHPFMPASVANIKGRITVWHLTGHKQFEGEVKNGLKQGLWSSWYESGLIEGQANFVNGERHGLSTRWYENGQMSFSFLYAKDDRDGPQKAWYPNGQLSASEYFVDGKEDGLTEVWNDDGLRVLRNSYSMGKRHGKQEEWFANGRLYVFSNFINGEIDGEAQWWWFGDGELNDEGRQVSLDQAQQLFKKYNDKQKKLKQEK